MQPRLDDLQPVFVILLAFIWSITPIVTTFRAIAAGFEYMTSQGEPQKIAEAREKLKNLGISLVFIFGSYLAAMFIITLLQVKDPAGPDCFTKPLTEIKFQFIFADVCTT